MTDRSNRHHKLPKTGGRPAGLAATWFGWVIPAFASESPAMISACHMFGCSVALCKERCGRREVSAAAE